MVRHCVSFFLGCQILLGFFCKFLYRVLRPIGYCRFDLNSWVWSPFWGRTSGGQRWAVVDILQGHWEGLSASKMSSSKHVAQRESLVIQRVIFCGFQPLTSMEVKTLTVRRGPKNLSWKSKNIQSGATPCIRIKEVNHQSAKYCTMDVVRSTLSLQ